MAGLSQEPMTGNGSSDVGREPVTGSKVLDWCWVLSRRRLRPDDALFEEGDIYCRLSSKYVPLEDKACMDSVQERVTEFPCGVAKCPLMFDSLAKFESHYSSAHRNVCRTCRRVYPSAHLLELHVLESHDVMFALLADKQNMFQCLLEDCGGKFAGSRERRNHMIGVHKYPANYRYDNHKYQRKLKKCPESTEGKKCTKPVPGGKMGVAMETNKAVCEQAQATETGTANNMDISSVVEQHDDICDPVTMETETLDNEENMPPPSSGRVFSYKVPQSLCFGQGVSRGFVRGRGRGRGKKRGKHWHSSAGRGGGDSSGGDSTVSIEAVDMMELSEALPS